jgi:excisionase family DNA binding protein
MPAPLLDDRWMSYRVAADYLGVSRKTLERAVTAKTIPHTRDPLTGRVRFLQSSLDEWMTKPKTRTRGRRA